MKRFTAAVLALMIAAVPMTGCNRTNGSKKKVSSKTVEQRKEETCEEAYRSMFNATYSQSGGETCLAYLMPQVVIEHMKETGTYEKYVNTFNDSQKTHSSLRSHTPEITKINETVKMTDAQLAGVPQYFVDYASGFNVILDPTGITIREGYEIHCGYVDENGNSGTDNNECAVYVENEGWKIIPLSASYIEDLGKKEATSSTAASDTTEK